MKQNNPGLNSLFSRAGTMLSSELAQTFAIGVLLLFQMAFVSSCATQKRNVQPVAELVRTEKVGVPLWMTMETPEPDVDPIVNSDFVNGASAWGEALFMCNGDKLRIRAWSAQQSTVGSEVLGARPQ